MEYKYLTQDDQHDVVAQAIIQREKEHHNYELNRLNYLHMLEQLNKELPADFPEDLKKFRSLGSEQLADVLSGDELDLASKLQFRDRVQMLLSTTIIEQTKVELVHAALEAALPKGDLRTAAIERVQAKAAAKEAAQAK